MKRDNMCYMTSAFMVLSLEIVPCVVYGSSPLFATNPANRNTGFALLLLWSLMVPRFTCAHLIVGHAHACSGSFVKWNVCVNDTQVPSTFLQTWKYLLIVAQNWWFSSESWVRKSFGTMRDRNRWGGKAVSLLPCDLYSYINSNIC